MVLKRKRQVTNNANRVLNSYNGGVHGSSVVRRDAKRAGKKAEVGTAQKKVGFSQL